MYNKILPRYCYVRANVGFQQINKHSLHLAAPSKQALKQKEKREKAKARKAEEKARGDASPPPPVSTSRAPFISSGDPEKDKKIKNLNKVMFWKIIYLQNMGVTRIKVVEFLDHVR